MLYAAFIVFCMWVIYDCDKGKERSIIARWAEDFDEKWNARTERPHTRTGSGAEPKE